MSRRLSQFYRLLRKMTLVMRFEVMDRRSFAAGWRAGTGFLIVAEVDGNFIAHARLHTPQIRMLPPSGPAADHCPAGVSV